MLLSTSVFSRKRFSRSPGLYSASQRPIEYPVLTCSRRKEAGVTRTFLPPILRSTKISERSSRYRFPLAWSNAMAAADNSLNTRNAVMLFSAEKPVQTPLHFVEEAFGPL